MALLRRVLYLDALASTILGVGLVAAPRFLLTTALGQPEYPDYAPLQVLGVALFTLALIMVLVGHRVEQLWWWCWAFVVFEAGIASVSTLHAAFGLPVEAAGWPWWAFALGAWAFAAAFLWGLARAGMERPPG